MCNIKETTKILCLRHSPYLKETIYGHANNQYHMSIPLNNRLQLLISSLACVVIQPMRKEETHLN